MKFTLEIELGNEAMQSWQDIRDALKETSSRRIGSKMTSHPKPTDGDGGGIMDTNGNKVGQWAISETPRESVERNNPLLTERQIRNAQTVDCTTCKETIFDDLAEYGDDEDKPYCHHCFRS